MNVLKKEGQRELVGSGTTRYQRRGEACPDCDGSDWCYSDLHPTFTSAPVGKPIEKPMKKLTCHHCTKPFEARRSSARYCSESCKQRAKRSR